MKKRFLVALIGVASVGTACSGQDRIIVLPAETTTTVEATTTTAKELKPIDQGSHTYDPEALFISRVHGETDLASYYYDDEILAFGQMVCQYFSGGGTATGLVEVIYDAGVQNNASDEVMLAFAGAAGIAVNELCPQYNYRLS